MMSNNILRPARYICEQIRHYINRSEPQSWKKDGKKYGLVTYYPRFPNHKDPPLKPSKVLLVQRIKDMLGLPYWEKNILKDFKIHLPVRFARPKAIVKNTPENCLKLWKVKHLIRVESIELPEDFDEIKDSDQISTYLTEHGKLLVFPKIDEERYEAAIKFKENPKRLDGDTLRERLRKKWLRSQDFEPDNPIKRNEA